MVEPVRLDTLSAADFDPHIGSFYELILPDDAALTLTLLSVTPMGRQERRRAFTLLFSGLKTPALPQKIYPLRHTSFGVLSIFLVPVRETAEHREYEAVFT